jgi:hypothetical protein
MAARKIWWRAFDISTRPGRDLVLFIGGLLGVVHETFLTSGERQYLLIMFGIMMGIPAYLAAGRQKEEARNGDTAGASSER